MPNPISDLQEITERVYNSALNLYAIFTKSSQPKSKPYSVAWQRRGSDTIREEQKFSSLKRARIAFDRAVQHIDEPQSEFFLEDTHQQAVYDWEDVSVYPYAKKLDEATIRKVVARVSKDYAIKKPKLSFIAEGQSSTYDSSDHAIELSDRTNITTLHEMAHAIVEKACSEDGREHVAHGPFFVWTLIELYHHYAGFNLAPLIIGAYQRDLLGDMNAIQYLPDFALSPNKGLASSQILGQPPDDGHGGPR